MKNIKIVFFGTPSYVVPILETLNTQFNVVGVVTGPDQKVGRHQKITSSPVAITTQAQKIPVFKSEKLDSSLTTQLSSLSPDLIVVASYGKLIPQSVLDIPKYGALNVHPSLLPKYRGATPIQSAILHGDTNSGITVIKMDKEMDHGPIVYREEYNFSADDTFESLANKMFKRAAEILVRLIPDVVAGIVEDKEQNHDQATFCSQLKKDDGYFEIGNLPSPELLDRM